MKSFKDYIGAEATKNRDSEEISRQKQHLKNKALEYQHQSDREKMFGHGGAAEAKGKTFAAAADNIKEEVEQIDELDTGTLKRYTKKSLSQTMSSAKKGDMETSNKRFTGMTKALDRIKTREPMDTSRSLKNITKNWHKEEVDQVEEASEYRGLQTAIQKRMSDKPQPTGTKTPAEQETIKRMKADQEAMAKSRGVKTEEVDLEESTPAWQRKEGKSESGGLNKKGIASYRRENPGSKLSMAVTTKPSKLKPGSKAANRRKSFCARMSGMKKRLTSAKTANDPDSRINKSLRKWNC